MAAKTPIIMVSSTSTSAKNVLVLRRPSSAACQEARMTTGTRMVASAISTSAMPSTPTANRMPKLVIQA